MNNVKNLSAALQVIDAFFGALRDAQWDSAAGMIDPDMASAFRKSELASLLAWARHRDAIIAMRHRGEGSVGWSSDGRVDAALVEKYGATPLRGASGAQTLAELAALSPRAFIATCLEASNGPVLNPDGDPIEMKRRVIGGVPEGDAIVHVLFRVEAPGIEHTDPLSVEIVRVRHSGNAWTVDPTSLGFGIASINSFAMLDDLAGEEAPSDAEPRAPDP